MIAFAIGAWDVLITYGALCVLSKWHIFYLAGRCLLVYPKPVKVTFVDSLSVVRKKPLQVQSLLCLLLHPANSQ